MNDKKTIVIGLVVALVVLTLPFWYSFAAGRPEPAPSLALPPGHCVEKDMRARHIELIDQWRDAVVREGETDPYESQDYPGELYERSLTKTCLLQCHAIAQAEATPAGTTQTLTVRQRFCQQCHDYANVRPDCWDCHLEGSPR
jgi:hypothetical protein